MTAAWKLWTALAVVYVVWGSTYLAIKLAVRTLPPLLTAGTRLLVAGLLLGILLVVVGRGLRTRRREALTAALLGLLMLGVGVGTVHLAETRIDSSVAAMIAGTVPLQIVLLRLAARDRPALATVLAATVGLGGLALVVVPAGSSSTSTALGLALMVGATMAWSTGSFASGRVSLPPDPFTTTTIQMLAAGVGLVLVGLVAGEWRDLAGTFEPGPVAAWAYLVLAGSLVGFSAYVWLLRSAPISLAVTHQYVNPIVAIALGAAFLGERPSPPAVAGAAVIVAAVFVTVRSESRQRSQATAAEPAVDSSP